MADIDKVFKAYDVRGIYGDEISEELAWKIGHASAQFLRSLLSGYERGQSSSNKLVIGRDMRPHSESLSEALKEGITSSGVGCIDLGMIDTPMLYFAINHLQTCGGVMITASHNPIEYNGFKISAACVPAPSGATTGLAGNTAHRQHASPHASREQSLKQASGRWYRSGKDYSQARAEIPQARRVRLKVVIDASNGMGGKMIPKPCSKIPSIEIIEPLNFKIGKGKFAHPPNPLVEANLKQVEGRRCVSGEGPTWASAWTATPTAACSSTRRASTVRMRHNDRHAYAEARSLSENPGSAWSFTTFGQFSRGARRKFIAAGGIPRRERVGHAFMKKTMADNHGIFGGELSGHFYFRDNFNCDSGAIAFATAITHYRIAEDLPLQRTGHGPAAYRYSHSGEMNFEVEDKEGKMKEIAETFSDAAVDWLDGVTIQYEDWWCNVRPSNTEPLLRLNLEAADKALMDQKIDSLRPLLGEPVDH